MNFAPKKDPTDCQVCPVRQLALFRPFTKTQLVKLRSVRMGQREVPAGTELYREGQQPGLTFTLFDGWVMRHKTLKDGRRQILSFALPGDLLGFHPRLDTPVTHSAQALTGVTLCTFSSQNLLELFSEYPELAMEIAWITARNEAIHHEHLTSLGRRPAKERIAHLLMELQCRVLGHCELHENAPVGIPLTQEYIADATGLTTIHVSRTLRTLREEKLLNLHNGRLTLLDRDGLLDLTGFQAHMFQPRAML